MLHYNPRHISSSITLVFRRSNCVIIASGMFTLCKWPYSTPTEISQTAYCTAFYRVTIPDAAITQFDFLNMSIVLLETC